MRRLHVEVSGIVQGVGFRWFVRQRARSMNLAGWVANTDAGTVEVAAEGDPAAIDSLLGDLRVGPPGARVDGVRALDPDSPTDLPTTFTVIR